MFICCKDWGEGKVLKIVLSMCFTFAVPLCFPRSFPFSRLFKFVCVFPYPFIFHTSHKLWVLGKRALLIQKMVSTVDPSECLRRVFERHGRYAENLMLDAEHPTNMPLPWQLWNHRPARPAKPSPGSDRHKLVTMIRLYLFNIVEICWVTSHRNKFDQIWSDMSNHNRTLIGPCEPMHVNTSVLRFIGSWRNQKVWLLLWDLNEAPYQRWHPQLTTACCAPSPLAPILFLTTAEVETCFPQETATAMLLAIKQHEHDDWHDDYITL